MRQSSKTILGIVFGLICLSYGFSAYAQKPSLYFKPPIDLIGVGDEFKVDLNLDTEGVTVNTIAGDILFSDSSLSLLRVETANSIVTSWIDTPVISGNSVTFSGIMPGGYESVIDPSTNAHLPAQIMTLVFAAKSEGSATLSFSDSHIYLNDSLGTETNLSSLPFTLTILPRGSGNKVAFNDTTPPEHFTPIVSTSPDIYDGAYTLFFSTVDKGSGIDHYEVREGENDWVRADSPYKLTDQSLRSDIRVKATDLAGNYVIEIVSGNQIPFEPTFVLIPLGLFLLVLVVLYLIYHNKMKKYKKS